MLPSIHDQLRGAWLASGLTVRALAKQTKIGRSSLHRKLHGQVPTTTQEAQIIAQALAHTIVWAPRRPRARRS